MTNKGSIGKSHLFTHFILFFTVLSVCIAISSAADWWPFGEGKTSRNRSKVNTAEIVVNEAPVSRDTKLTTSFSSTIHKASPAVVSIKTSSYVRGRQINPLLKELFNLPDEMESGKGHLRPRGIGSGVIVSKDGYILTNNHVIKDADEILIDFADKDDKEYPASIVGSDPRTDLAVLKLDTNQELPAATLGNSDNIEVGDIVLAIGNPFGLGQTVTMGIISATGRQQVIPPGTGVIYQDFIQTDASINPGNSGGALIDAEGRLIGINTAIFSRTGENLGIGFAVPIKLARHVMEQLIEKGKVSRGYIGVNVQEVDEDIALSYGLKSDHGALITRVEEDSPAAQAGLKRDDIILQVGTTEILNVSDLLLSISQEAPDSTIDLIIIRDGKKQTIPVTLKERPDEVSLTMDRKNKPQKDESEVSGELFSGIMIQDITPTLRAQLKIPDDVHGALITQVTPNTPAAEAGLNRGMIIMEITAGKKSKQIETAQDAIHFGKSVRSHIARLYVYDRSAYRYFVLKDK